VGGPQAIRIDQPAGRSVPKPPRVARSCEFILAISTASPAAAVEIDQVADGFAGPLGLAIGGDGTVYVAQVFLGTLTAIDRDGDRTDLVTGEPVAGGVEALGRGQVVYTTRVGEEGVPPSEANLMRVTPAGNTRQLASLLAYEAAENPDATNLYGLVDLDPACAAEVDEALGGQVATTPVSRSGRLQLVRRRLRPRRVRCRRRRRQ
jgi:hypothetical protein